MKKTLTLLLLVVVAITTNAQAPPEAFNYSAVARDANSNPIANSTIGIQMSILMGSPTGNTVYQENHFVNTDDYGLFNLIVGGGSILSGTIADIDWSLDDYYLQVGMDANGGTNFLIMGTTQLLSVPYALYAKSAGSVNGGSQIDSAAIANMGFLSSGGCGLSIGDYHAGGIVFYIDASGCHGLVVKETDEPDTYPLFNTDVQTGNLLQQDGAVTTQYLIQYRDLINSNSSIFELDTILTCPAVEVCYNLVYNGFDDWYLPTSNEMVILITNLYNTGLVTNFVPHLEASNLGYWTSTTSEYSPKTSAVFFTLGLLGVILEYNEEFPGYVRAVRAF